MALFNRKRDAQQRSSNVGVTCISLDSPGILAGSGYHRMCDAPEVASAIWIIADLVSSMPIHLLEKHGVGDRRIRDALAHKIDVDPWSLSTRKDWVHWIVQTMLIDGESVVIPQTA